MKDATVLYDLYFQSEIFTTSDSEGQKESEGTLYSVMLVK